MTNWSIDNVTTKLIPIQDPFLLGLKKDWFNQAHRPVNYAEFIMIADRWFKSTTLNDLQGWDTFPCIDVIIGCTHFIESLIIKYGRDGIQILPEEYAYYSLMGIHGTAVGNLKPNIPLIISLPNWRYADIRPEWPDVLKECEAKNIDIHIDFAWITAARDIVMDLSHPNIKSIGMSISKYALEWNRIGLRWSRQRTSDPITMFNHYHGDVNTNLTTCGAFMMKNIPRDYGWNTYSNDHYKLCKELNLQPSKLVHVAHASDYSGVLGIGQMLSARPNSV